MPKILISYYSRSGNTKIMAKIIAEAATEAGAQVDIKSVDQIRPDDLLQYEAIVMGSPTYYGLMAAPMKKLLDESVKLHGQLEGKIGGAFSSSANIAGGNETTIMSIIQAWLIHGMIVQGDSKGDHYGPVSIGKPDERAEGECRRYGARLVELVKRLAG